MGHRPKTQMGHRLIQRVWKWVESLEVEARLRKVMESQGMNHDIHVLLLIVMSCNLHTTH